MTLSPNCYSIPHGMLTSLLMQCQIIGKKNTEIFHWNFPLNTGMHWLDLDHMGSGKKKISILSSRWTGHQSISTRGINQIWLEVGQKSLSSSQRAAPDRIRGYIFLWVFSVMFLSLSILPSCHRRGVLFCKSSWQKFLIDLLHWWDSSSRLEKVSEYNMLMERRSVRLSLFIWYHLCLGCGEYMADQLTWISGTQTNERYPDSKHKKIWEPLWIENHGTCHRWPQRWLQWPRHSAIEHFFME